MAKEAGDNGVTKGKKERTSGHGGRESHAKKMEGKQKLDLMEMTLIIL